MLSRDYIGKTIETLSRLVATLAGLREKGKFEEGIIEIKSAFQQALSSDMDDYTAVPYHRIMPLLKEEKGYSNEQLAAAAVFFGHLGDFLEYKVDHVVAMEAQKKALVILRWLQKNDLKNYVLQREDQIKVIEDKIRQIANRDV